MVHSAYARLSLRFTDLVRLVAAGAVTRDVLSAVDGYYLAEKCFFVLLLVLTESFTGLHMAGLYLACTCRYEPYSMVCSDGDIDCVFE